MRLSELLRYRAFDVNGESLDHVKDVRLRREGQGWVVTHVVVGRTGIAQRLGFMPGVVERPALLARLMKWIGRHAWAARWEDVTLQPERVILVDVPRRDLPPPEAES